MENSGSKKGMSLKWKVIMLAAAVLVITAAAISVSGYRTSRDEVLNSAVGYTHNFSRMLQASITGEFGMVKDKTKGLADIITAEFKSGKLFTMGKKSKVGDIELSTLFVMKGNDMQQLTGDDSLVDSWKKNLGGDFTIFQLVELNGKKSLARVATTIQKKDGARAVGTILDEKSPAYAKILEGQVYSGYTSIFGRDYMAAYVPFFDENNNLAGAVFCGAPLEAIISLVINSGLGSSNSYGMVIDNEGIVIGHPKIEKGSSIKESAPEFWNALSAHTREKGASSDVFKVDYIFMGSEKFAFIIPVPDIGWDVALTFSLDELLAPTLNIRDGMIIWAVASILVGLALLALLLVRFLNPLNIALNAGTSVASGDLSVAIDGDEHSRDEIKAVLGAFGSITNSFKNLVFETRNINDQIENKGRELNDLSESFQDVSLKTRQAAETIVNAVSSISAAAEETNAGVEEVSAGAQNTAKISSDLSSNALAVGREIQAGSDAVENVAKGINKVGEASARVVEAIKSLEESVNNIAGFVDTITSIADQTNLLALNAAIEAARAGDAGRGFAVVADEVRKLAEQSNKAAHEVDRIIGEVQSRTKAASLDTVEAGRLVGLTVDSANETAKRINDIMRRIEKITDGIQSIAAAAQQQSASSEEIASAMDNIVRMIAEGQGAAEDVGKAAGLVEDGSGKLGQVKDELFDTVNRLEKLVSRFKLERDTRLLAVPD